MKNSIQRNKRFGFLLKILTTVVCVIVPIGLRPAYAQHGGISIGGGHMGGGHFGAGHFAGGAHAVGHAGHSPHLTYVPSRGTHKGGNVPFSRGFRHISPGRGIPIGSFGFRSRGRFGSFGFWPYGFWPFWDDWWDDSFGGRGEYRGTDDNSQGEEEESGDGDGRPVVVFYLRDGSGYAALDYWLVNGVLHIETSYGAEKTFPLDEVDLQRTSKEAAEHGVTFTLRTYPSPSAPGPLLAQDSYAPTCEGRPGDVAKAVEGSRSEGAPHAASGKSGFGASGDGREDGLHVTSVTGGSLAARAAIRPGDVILQVDCRPIHNSTELEAALGANGSGSLWVSYLIQGTWLTEKRVTIP